MDGILHPYFDSFVNVYLDDTLIYNATCEEHISHLMHVLKTLKKHQILENHKKCGFEKYSLLYLGYVIGGGELKIDLAKIEAIMKWLMPTNVFEVKRYIGEAQYLREFIVSFFVVEALIHVIEMSSKSF